MSLTKKVFKSVDELKLHIQTHKPTFYISSQTSTVIPYDKIEKFLPQNQEYYIGDLSGMPRKMEVSAEGDFVVAGAVSWKEAREFLKPKGRNIMTAPTEELALITAGAATSCTGERCFAYGNLRGQVKKIKYINFMGEEIELDCNRSINLTSDALKTYQQEFNQYRDFKNAPFPRFETETDLLIGTEGQLGVITEITLKTVALEPVQHLFMLLPKWENDYSAHLEIIEKIQSFRDHVISCELIDANAFSFLKEEERPNQGMDAIFFEIKQSSFEHFYENFLATLTTVSEENIFELTESKFHHTRASVPRAVFEENSRMGVLKMGTDVQVKIQDFSKLLDIYRNFATLGVRYNLFGHFGDAHLHFNFMPKPEDTTRCQEKFEWMYGEIAKLKGSPFAEHGIGILKQKYIKNFWTSTQPLLFKQLKTLHDPHNQFFPQGFMNL
jgi:FAD/FMN-containing dehydrogenase